MDRYLIKISESIRGKKGGDGEKCGFCLWDSVEIEDGNKKLLKFFTFVTASWGWDKKLQPNWRCRLKRLVLLSLATLLCLPLAVYAIGIGGVETQGEGKVGIGVVQEFVFERDLEDKSVELRVTTPGGLAPATGTTRSKVDEMSRTMLKTSYGLTDNVDMYIKLGVASFDSEHRGSGTWRLGAATGRWVESVKIEGDDTLAYGIGMKVTQPLENGWLVGLNVQHLRHDHDTRRTGSQRVYNAAGVLVFSETFTPRKGEMRIQETQVAPYIAKELGMGGSFIPYFGVVYSELRGRYKENGIRERHKADDNFGVFLGADYKIGLDTLLNVEARLIDLDQTALSLGATHKF